MLMYPQANCIDSTASPEAVFASEVKKMSAENMKPQEQLTLEPYERDHAVVVGVYRSDTRKVIHTTTVMWCNQEYAKLSTCLIIHDCGDGVMLTPSVCVH